MRKPRIRFQGYTDEWEQRKLGDCVEFLDTQRKPLEGAKRVSGPYPYYGASGIVDYVDGYLFDEELVLLSEDGANITDRNYPVCFLASGKYWVNNHAHVLKTLPENENNFICNSLERKDYTQYNTGMAMPKLNKEVCKSIPVECPAYEEQKKIGDYFRNLDHLITLHQRKCEETKTLKKYMLQKMFPQNGQSVPEIRFSGFTGVWEERKLGELLEFHNGFNGGAERYGTGIPLISVMDILNNDFVISKNIRTRADLTEDEFTRFKVEYGDVLFQRSSENIEDAGTSNVYLDSENKAVFGGFVICGKKKSEYNPLFMRYGLTNRNVRSQIMSKAQGAQHINVSQETLRGVAMYTPSQEEQTKIGKYFSNLDHLITLHQQKCDLLKNLKKYMLQNMFPQ